MGKTLTIKGRTLGNGKPLVCVPVMASTKESILEETKKLIEKKVEMIEWRVDAFSDVENMNALREVLCELAPLTKDVILVYTFRSAAQGGLKELPSETVFDIHQIAAETSVADLIDVEFFAEKKASKEIRLLHEMGAKVIASHHDFEETPEATVLHMLLEQMNESDADVVKLAVMPQSAQDVLALLTATAEFHEEYPKQPLITMSMGKLGMISRIAGETFGSCVTFGASEVASAPGQLPFDELSKILTLLN